MRSTDGKASQANRVEAPKHKSRKHTVRRIDIEKADNGGYSVQRHFKVADGKPGEIGAYKEPETHVFENFEAMHDAMPELLEHKGDPARVQEDVEET